MGLFARHGTPELRKFTDKHAVTAIRGLEESDPDSLILALSALLLKGASEFFHRPSVSQKEDLKDMEDPFRRSLESFDNDWCIFEVFCYIFFRLDVWIFTSGNRVFREKFFNGKVSRNCLEVFSAIFKTDDVYAAFNNRCEIYGRALRDHEGIERELSYLAQFVFRGDAKELSVYDVEKDFQVVLRGITDEMVVHTRMTSHMESMFPVYRNLVKETTARLEAQHLL